MIPFVEDFYTAQKRKALIGILTSSMGKEPKPPASRISKAAIGLLKKNHATLFLLLILLIVRPHSKKYAIKIPSGLVPIDETELGMLTL